jgi:hypothetical protein
MNFEKSGKSLEICITEAMLKFATFNATNIFRKCGYLPNGVFNPAIALDQPLKDFEF